MKAQYEGEGVFSNLALVWLVAHLQMPSKIVVDV